MVRIVKNNKGGTMFQLLTEPPFANTEVGLLNGGSLPSVQQAESSYDILC